MNNSKQFFLQVLAVVNVVMGMLSIIILWPSLVWCVFGFGMIFFGLVVMPILIKFY